MKLLEIKRQREEELSFKDLMARTNFDLDHYIFTDGTLQLFALKLTSLEGCPTMTRGDCNVGANLITTLEHVPRRIGHTLAIQANKKLHSLQHIESQIDHIGNAINLSPHLIKSHVLGLVLIDGLKSIWCVSESGSTFGADGTKYRNDWSGIVDAHLRLDKPPKEKMYLCQEALLNADFIEHARL